MIKGTACFNKMADQVYLSFHEANIACDLNLHCGGFYASCDEVLCFYYICDRPAQQLKSESATNLYTKPGKIILITPQTDWIYINSIFHKIQKLIVSCFNRRPISENFNRVMRSSWYEHVDEQRRV